VYMSLAEYTDNIDRCMALAQIIDVWFVDEMTGRRWLLTSERQSLWDRVAAAILPEMNVQCRNHVRRQ